MHRFLVTTAALLLFATGCDGGDDETAGPGDDNTTTPAGDATWHAGVGKLLVEKCGGCHQAGGVAPFPVTYEDSKVWANAIKASTGNRTMPPMPVNNDGSCNTFENARWLTASEIDYIAKWVDAGAPEGVDEGASYDPPMVPHLDNPDLVLELPEPFTPSDAMIDDYRCFPVDPGLEQDAFITGYEVVPTEPGITHHMILYLIEANQAAAVKAEDAKSDTPGYPCFGAVSQGNEIPLVVWAPGGGFSELPEGTGLRIPAGRTLVIQMHYNLEKGPAPDQTAVRLRTAQSVAKEALMLGQLDLGLVLPPAQESVSNNPVASQNGLLGISQIPSTAFTIHGVFPHMHTLGRTLKVVLNNGDSEQCIVDVDRWDFNWQDGWWYDTPLTFGSKTGRTARIDCSYDTTGRQETVGWGDGTFDEMCLNYVYVTGP